MQVNDCQISSFSVVLERGEWVSKSTGLFFFFSFLPRRAVTTARESYTLTHSGRRLPQSCATLLQPSQTHPADLGATLSTAQSPDARLQQLHLFPFKIKHTKKENQDDRCNRLPQRAALLSWRPADPPTRCLRKLGVEVPFFKFIYSMLHVSGVACLQSLISDRSGRGWSKRALSQHPGKLWTKKRG